MYGITNGIGRGHAGKESICRRGVLHEKLSVKSTTMYTYIFTSSTAGCRGIVNYVNPKSDSDLCLWTSLPVTVSNLVHLQAHVQKNDRMIPYDRCTSLSASTFSWHLFTPAEFPPIVLKYPLHIPSP